MAYRRTSSRPAWRKLKPSDVLPLWTPAHSDAANLVFKSAMVRFGITDFSSYRRKLRIPIVISVIVGILVGASNYGFRGIVLGGVLGLMAPISLLWLGVVLSLILAYLAVYCIAIVVIYAIAWWFHSGPEALRWVCRMGVSCQARSAAPWPTFAAGAIPSGSWQKNSCWSRRTCRPVASCCQLKNPCRAWAGVGCVDCVGCFASSFLR